MRLAKTTAERVAAMRAARDLMGLKRLELYAHSEDWPQIKALADRLAKLRNTAKRNSIVLGRAEILRGRKI